MHCAEVVNIIYYYLIHANNILYKLREWCITQDSLWLVRLLQTFYVEMSVLFFKNTCEKRIFFRNRRSWCTNADGALLHFIAEVVQEELSKYTLDEPHPFKSHLENALEQCYYCLYGHPNKRAKAKHLQDHSAPQVRQRAALVNEISLLFNPSNAEATFVQSTRMQRFLKTI